MFIYHTADGGASWEEQYYEYEASALSLQVLPGRVVVGGGPVGVASNGFVWESTDGPPRVAAFCSLRGCELRS